MFESRGGASGSGRRSSERGGGGRGERGSRPPARTVNPAQKAARMSRYQIPAGTKIDYKNFSLLQKYVTDRGKIISRRITGVSARQQRALSQSIRRARFLGLLQIGVRRKI